MKNNDVKMFLIFAIGLIVGMVVMKPIMDVKNSHNIERAYKETIKEISEKKFSDIYFWAPTGNAYLKEWESERQRFLDKKDGELSGAKNLFYRIN